MGVFNGYRTLTDELGTYTPPVQRPAQIAKVAAAKRKTAIETKNKANNVKRDIQAFYKLSKTPTQSQNKYLTDKKIHDFANLTNCDIRYGTDKHGQFTAILLTSARTGQPVGVQKFYDHKIKYFDDTNKLFTKGMSTSGACYQIGIIDNTTKHIAFCEGFANAAVLNIFWKCPVIVTLDAGNIGHVTSAYKAKYPKLEGIIACDNDAHKYDRTDNGGVLKGVAAAQKNGYQFVIPNFKKYKQSTNPTDIWDLWQLGGDESIHALMDTAKNAPNGQAWHKFKLNYTGLKDSKTPLKPLQQAILNLVGSICHRAPFHTSAHIEKIHKAIHAQAKRLKKFKTFDESVLLKYVKSSITRLSNQNLKQAQAKYTKWAIKPTTTINSQWLKSPLYPTMLINSGVGTGKTEWLKKLVISGKYARILIITPRRALAINSAERYSTNDCDVVVMDYEDIKGATPRERSMMDTRKISCVSNSLVTLGISANDQYDLIILDEIELGIQHYYSNAVPDNEHQAMLDVLRGLIKNTEYLIGAQDGISTLTLDFLKSCGREDIHSTLNTYQRFKGLPIDLFLDKADCTARLHSLVSADIPVIVPCSSINFGHQLDLELRERYPNKKILFLNKYTISSIDQQNFINNPNKYAKEWDIIIHTPALEQGVSIDVPHFKEIIGFCVTGEGTGTPEAFRQMNFRSRFLDRISLYCETQQYNNPIDFEAYLAGQYARFDVAAKAVMIDGKQGHFFEKTPDIINATKAKASEAESKNDTIGRLYAIFVAMGCKINIIRDCCNEGLRQVGQELLDGGKAKQKVDYQQQLSSAIKLTKKDYEELNNKAAIGQSEQWQLDRYQLERDLALNLDDQTECDIIFEHWKKGSGGKLVQALGEAILSPEHALAVTQYLLDNKSCNSDAQGFRTRYLIRRGLLESLHIIFDRATGEMAIDPDFKFRYSDFKSIWWYKFACDNRDAVNASGLGARLNSNTPTDKQIGIWIGFLIKAMGIKLAMIKGSGPELDSISLSNNKSNYGPKRKRINYYVVSAIDMDFTIATLKRRFKSGDMPWQTLAEKQLEQAAMQAACQDHGQFSPSQSIQQSTQPAITQPPISPITQSIVGNDLGSRLLKELGNLVEIEPHLQSVGWGVDWLAIVLDTTRQALVSLAQGALQSQIVLIEGQQTTTLSLVDAGWA
ncbi:MAG: hypothetical protein QM504_10405 [Pseudomonadota bacterium]